MNPYSTGSLRGERWGADGAVEERQWLESLGFLRLINFTLSNFCLESADKMRNKSSTALAFSGNRAAIHQTLGIRIQTNTGEANGECADTHSPVGRTASAHTHVQKRDA